MHNVQVVDLAEFSTTCATVPTARACDICFPPGPGLDSEHCGMICGHDRGTSICLSRCVAVLVNAFAPHVHRCVKHVPSLCGDYLDPPGGVTPDSAAEEASLDSPGCGNGDLDRSSSHSNDVR
eukprot:14465502-Heterocapsa_arctica.AAC.1